MAVALAVDVPDVASDNLQHTKAAMRHDITLWHRSRWLWLVQSITLIALSFGLWVGCLHLFQLHNDFPAIYHPDEGSKGEQLLQDERNFKHPQLMLETALLIVPSLQTPKDANGQFIGPRPDVDTVVREGRTVSAGFAAGTAVLLAWAGWAAADWIGFLGLGLAVGLCPALFSHAHFFKEDASLMFGIAVVLCAGAWALRLRGPQQKHWTIIFLGIGVGLAAAGKYCGVVMAVPALLVALVACRRHWGLLLASPLVVLVFAVVTWLAIDYRIFNDFQHFIENANSEETHSISSHNGVTMDRPNNYFTSRVWTEAMPHVKVLAALAILVLPWQMWKRRRWGFGVWLAVCIAIYLTMLAYSVIPFYRYALPATVMLYAFAALGMAWLASLPPRPWMRATVGIIGLLVIGGLQGVRVADYIHQFDDDSRDALRDWINTTLPDGTPVAVDEYTALSNHSRFGSGPAPTRVNIVEDFFGLDACDTTVDQLRRRGVKYVITASSTSERFDSPYVHGMPENEQYVKNVRGFYDSLKQYPVAWHQVAEHPMWTFANPDIVVYQIDTPPK